MSETQVKEIPEVGNLKDALKEYLKFRVPKSEIDNETIENTPRRWLSALYESTFGYDVDIDFIMGRDFEEPTDQIVIIKEIPFSSICSHHLYPFVGFANIAYIPRNRVLGLSKFARLVEAYAKRLQVQERMTSQIADSIEKYLKPIGTMVVLKAHHTCMATRGIEKDGWMVTSVIRGKFRANSPARTEALELFKL